MEVNELRPSASQPVHADSGVWKGIGGKAPLARSPQHWKPLLPSHLNIHTQGLPQERSLK